MMERGLILLASLALAVLAAPPVQAARAGTERPVRAELTGLVTFDYDWSSQTCPVTTTTESQGTMSHLGTVSARWTHCAPVALPVYTNGHVTFTAANGDTLEARYDGVLDEPWPLEVSGGTGRFSDATGVIYLDDVRVWGDWGDDDLPIQPWDWAGTLTGQIGY